MNPPGAGTAEVRARLLHHSPNSLFRPSGLALCPAWALEIAMSRTDTLPALERDAEAAVCKATWVARTGMTGALRRWWLATRGIWEVSEEETAT